MNQNKEHDGTVLHELLEKYYNHTREMIIFINQQGQVIHMNDAARAVISEDNTYKNVPNAICKRCEGYSNEYALQTCENCFLESVLMQDTSFQVFMKTVHQTIEPFTATYQVIDAARGIKAFTLQNVAPQIERQERLHRRNMMQKTISAQENERKRISRELHDGVVQEMLNVGVELRLLKYQDDMEALIGNSKRIEGLMSKLIDDIRHLSVELRPSSLDDLGLDAAFRSYFKQFEKNYGIYVRYHSNVDAQRFDSEIETVTYRIVQEAIMNAFKYAQVDNIDVHLNYKDNLLTARIIDEGVGFEPGAQPKGTGLGLFGMRERAELVNGHVNIETRIDQGTVVQLEVPVKK